MLTRHQRNKEEKKRGYLRKLIARSCLERFRNPTSNYKLTESIYISEAILKDPDCKISFFEALFEYNRIVRCARSHSMIRCQLEQYDCNYASLEYVTARLRSFEDKIFTEVADGIEKAAKTKSHQYPKQLARLLPSPDDIVRHYENDMCVIMTRDLIPELTTFNKFYLSKKLIEYLGYTEEELMIGATKFGCIGNGETTDLDFISLDYINQLIMYLRAQMVFKEQEGMPAPRPFEEMAMLNQVETNWRTINSTKVKVNVNQEIIDWNCTFICPSPNCLVIKFKYANQGTATSSQIPCETSQSQMEVEATYNTKIQAEELNVLKHLVFIPENMLPVNKDLVCQYRTTN